ncbi:glycosyltransferase family 4 protein [Desulfopila aestuarii]|uniref:Glycosyl transferase 4-like domain-containing protein n=1 Tax=Desulfopila aestuarii DSM 18488 TaxID=1121416 RepID=A0A1M7Y4D6_9BACT|nr:glycosyltransferase family 4 protein [Desulfopila aestuarii]SHO46995.1 Glycosyl transferase 4-like domain-containing protein [Desulfopila aestuarii DSM 18488]
MKILHLISQHPESTGSGFYLQNIIRQASAAGHQNYLIAGISGNMLPQLDCISTQSCRFVHFNQGQLDYPIPGMSDVMPYPSSTFGSLSPAQLAVYERAFGEVIERAVFDYAPDIIHSHHLWLVSAIARERFPTIPMVTSCHSTDLRQFLQCPHIGDRVLPHCQKIERVLALNDDQTEKIRKLYLIPPHRIDVVGGGYDESVFVMQPKDKPPPVQMLYAGKLSFAKGVDVLLRAFQSFEGTDVHLHLAGSGTGEEGQCCLDLAEKMGSLVTIHGRINQQDLARLMARCHLFILPSFYEGLPLVLLEALASGCRIITADLSGCKEILGDADSDLIEFIQLPVMKQIDRPEPEDLPMVEKRLKAAITSMMARVLVTPSPAHGDILKITSRFGWGAVFRKINQAYDKAFNGL